MSLRYPSTFTHPVMSLVCIEYDYILFLLQYRSTSKLGPGKFGPGKLGPLLR